MKTLSLKLEDSIFIESNNILSEIKLSRNKYINEAIEYYNQYQKRKLIEQKLKKESLLVRKESLKILREFEIFEDEN